MSATVGLGERRYDLDWVRIGAFLLLILYHIGMYYVTWDWHVKSPHASSAIEPLMLLTSPWRLSLLFFVSGVATAYLLERQSVRGFLGRRSVRLLVPLVFGMLVIVPPQAYLEVVEKVQYAGNYGEFLGLYLTAYHGFCRDGDCLIMPTWNHLWFVAYLWVYTLLLYVAVRAAPGVVPRLREWLERRFTGLGVLWWPIVYLAAARMLLAVHFPSTHELVNDWYNHAVYAAVFVLGFALAGARAPWETIERLRWHALGFAVLGWVFLCVWHGLDNIDALPSSVVLRRVWQLAFSAQIWLAIVAVLGFARRHLNRDNAARRYLTTAVFPVYILHQTVIVVAAHALQPVRLDPLLEGLVLVLVTTTLCFLGYDVIRRIGVLRPLFGLAVSADGERLRTPVPRSAA
ncbi:MAG TPA: acyltransferase family protein [Gammaproteobacteria bacterium]